MCFEDPVCVFGVGDEEVVPLDLEVAGRFLEERRAGEAFDVEFGFGWHN